MKRRLSPKKQQDIRLLRTMTEQPETFEIEGKDGDVIIYKLYPLQLGRLELITERLIQLDLCLDNEDGNNVVQQMWDICSSMPKQVAEIIAIATLRTKEDIDTHLDERTQEMLWSPTLTPEVMAKILYTIIFQTYHQDFMKAIRLVKILSVQLSQSEREERIVTEATPSMGL